MKIGEMSSFKFSESVDICFDYQLSTVLKEMRLHSKGFHRLARLAGLFFEIDGTANTVVHKGLC